MKRSLLVLMMALLHGRAFTQSPAVKLDEYLTAHARLSKFNGVVLVAKQGQVLLHKGYGWRDARKRIPHNEQSVFQIGSITKQFTATIILYLQEKGKLNVQDKLSKFIPGYPQGDKITIEHLLTHTSGIFSYTSDSRFMNLQAVKPVTFEQMLQVFKDKPLSFEPGTGYAYNNSAYILLGHIIQKVSGKPYEQMVREVIFQPLQMQQSGFDFKALASPAKSTGYFALGNDTVPSSLVDSSVSYAAGAIYSTTADLYKWHKALYTDKVIKQSSLEKAFTPYKNKYGYGWVIDTLNKRRVISHNGSIFGFTSDMWRVPADDVCIILLCNKPENLGIISTNLFNILYDLPYEIPKERTEIKLPDSLLRQYTGEYELAVDFKIIFTVENGRLQGQPTNQPKVELYAQRENFFFLKVVDAQVEFVKSADGKVEKMILYQGGVRQEGKRIK